MITVLSGINVFQRNAQLNQLTAAFVAEHSDLALEKIEAENATYNQISGAIESLPFLSSKKMVVVYDLSLNKEAAEKLEPLTALAGETTDLILVETKPDKRGSYYKQLKKLPNFKEYNELDDAAMAIWLSHEATALGGTLSRSDANYLVQRVGANQLRLSNELQKLVQYNSVITRATIEELTDDNPSSTVFNLIDSVFSGNPKQAMRIYDEQRQQKVEPQAIHGMLVWQMHAVAIAVAAPESADAGQIAKDSGMSPYVIQKSQRIARAMGRAKIISFMKLLRDMDYRGKHEAFDYDEALRYAILTLAF